MGVGEVALHIFSLLLAKLKVGFKIREGVHHGRENDGDQAASIQRPT